MPDVRGHDLARVVISAQEFSLPLGTLEVCFANLLEPARRRGDMSRRSQRTASSHLRSDENDQEVSKRFVREYAHARGERVEKS
jgi:hypothetical protein